MKSLFGIVPVFVGILFFFGCSSDRITGTKGGSETTNGIIATVFTEEGHPAVGSIVRVRRSDYVRNPDSSYQMATDWFDSVTDESGNFMVRGLEPSSYYIEINDTVNRGGAVLCTCTVGETDTVDLGNQVLRPHGRMRGNVDRRDSGDDELVVHVRGLERTAPVAQDGAFMFDDLPAGRMDVVVVNRSEKNRQEVRDVMTLPGDSISVQVSARAGWSRYLYLDSLVAGIADSAVYTSFPLLVRLDGTTFDFSQARSEGEDIRFTKTDGIPFMYEIEQWDQDAQTAAIWVELDTVFGGRTGQAVVMQWGDSQAESQSDGSAIFSSDDGYTGVWHLGRMPESAGTSGTIEAVPGMIGDALRFDGIDEQIILGPLNVSGDYTLSCWINAADLGADRGIIWKDSSYALWYDRSLGGLRVEHYSDSLVWWGGQNAVPIDTDMWYFIVGTFDGNKIHIYVNGEIADSSEVIPDNPHSSAAPLVLGGRDGEYFTGIMDEVRVENVKHSAGWVRLCYLNQRR